MHRVFVSSTYTDLKECRKTVRTALRRMGHEDVAMEYFVAEAQRPLDKCLGDVKTCDLYVGIFAMRYGYIPQGYDKSITELEYRTARERDIPCIILLLKEDAPWPVNRIDNPRDRIEALRQELKNEHVVSFFSGEDDIEARLIEALYNHDNQDKNGSSQPGEPGLTQERDTYLVRIRTGRELTAVITGSHAYQFDYDDVESEEELELVRTFLQFCQDYGDLADELDIGAQVQMGFELNQTIEALEGSGWFVFAGRHNRKFKSAKGEGYDWSVSVINLLRQTNPGIVKVSPLQQEAVFEAPETAKGVVDRDKSLPLRIEVVGAPVIGQDTRFAMTEPWPTIRATLLITLQTALPVRVRELNVVNEDTGEVGKPVAASVMELDPAEKWEEGFLLEGDDRFTETFTISSLPKQIRFEIVAAGRVCQSESIVL